MPDSRFTGRPWGWLAGFAAAAIGAGWQVATRQATTTVLPPADLLLLRYGLPALLLSPLLLAAGWRHALWPRGLPGPLLLAIVAGAGAPFGLVAVSGTQFAPAAHMGVLLAAASPVLAALWATLVWREPLGRARAGGLALMSAGVLLLGAPAVRSALAPGADGAWRGDLLFLAAAALWATYTLAFRRAQRRLGADGLSAWRATALVNAWSALVVGAGWCAWMALGGRPPLQAPPSALLGQLLWQGVLAGVLGLWTFNAAIARLGAAQAAAFGALVPALSALGGWWWLGERPGTIAWIAVGLTVAGVALASGAVGAIGSIGSVRSGGSVGGRGTSARSRRRDGASA